VKSVPLSLTIPLGSPNREPTFSKNTVAKSFVLYFSSAGIYSAIFDSLSMTTSIELYTTLLFLFAGGSLTIRSREISSYIRSGIGSGKSLLNGKRRGAFDL